MPNKTDQVVKIADYIGKAKILILGDIMLDEYLHGTVSRISPEAPVPVVWVDRENFMPGGASKAGRRGLERVVRKLVSI